MAHLTSLELARKQDRLREIEERPQGLARSREPVAKRSPKCMKVWTWSAHKRCQVLTDQSRGSDGKHVPRICQVPAIGLRAHFLREGTPDAEGVDLSTPSSEVQRSHAG